jgi:nicotinamide riboside transporter PnuC
MASRYNSMQLAGNFSNKRAIVITTTLAENMAIWCAVNGIMVIRFLSRFYAPLELHGGEYLYSVDIVVFYWLYILSQ